MPPEAPVSHVAFVTGAAGGIGRAVVRRLAAGGVRVCATDVVPVPDTADPAGLLTLQVDVTDASAIAHGLTACASRFGRVDHVVHLAGRAGGGTLDATSVEEWRALLDTNLTSAFLVARAAHPLLRAVRGSLTLMASTNGRNGGSSLSGPAYAAAKAGVLNLSRYLAREWAGEGIRVNCVAPGPIDTAMVARFDAATRERLAASVPLGRMGTADEVAAAIAWLVGSEASYVTGAVMNVSGGLVLD
jgi:NAD(P)-dependent dehydrogenase (short-subunit alcohol dehydrogenase family)